MTRSPDESIPNSVKILGITGGIGSGKSSACQILTSPEFKHLHNCEVHHIDSDSIAHSVYAPGSEAILQIRSEFGDHVISTNSDKENNNSEEVLTIDRKKLGEIVFNDAQAMSKLEQIVWPHVKDLILEKVKQIATNDITDEKNMKKNITKVAVLEAAVLLDANWSNLLSALWILTASSNEVTNRLLLNRNITQDDANTRIEAQKSRRGIGNLEEEIQKKEVNAVIVNNGTLEELQQKLKDTWFNNESWRDGNIPMNEKNVQTS